MEYPVWAQVKGTQGKSVRAKGLLFKPLSWGNANGTKKGTGDSFFQDTRLFPNNWTQIHWMSDHVSIVGFQRSLLACRNTSCTEKNPIHLPQLPLPSQRGRNISVSPTARWLGFNFIIMIHRQTLIEGFQSQGTAALKSYLKKFLYIRALIWKVPHDMTDWLGDKENNLWHSLW